MTCKIAGLFFYPELCIAKRSKTPRVEALFPPSGDVMIYTFLSSVFFTLFLIVGALALTGFLQLMRNNFPLNWTCYQHVIILAAIAVLCFIIAVIFGAQIPNCYVR